VAWLLCLLEVTWLQPPGSLLWFGNRESQASTTSEWLCGQGLRAGPWEEGAKSPHHLFCETEKFVSAYLEAKETIPLFLEDMSAFLP
jgi:hypothetical protein